MKERIKSKDVRKLVRPLKSNEFKIGDKVYVVPLHRNVCNLPYENSYLGTVSSIDSCGVVYISLKDICTINRRIPFYINQKNIDLNFVLVKKLIGFKIIKLLNI